MIDKHHLSLYHCIMIGNIKHRGLKRLYEHADRSKVPADYADKLQNILSVLDVALTIEDVDLPGFRLHALAGDLKGFWSITVRSNWRVIFRFKGGKALDIDLVDYH